MRPRPIVPGKTYEYLAARRAILAAVPEGDAKDYVARAGNAQVCEPADVNQILEALKASLNRRSSNAEPPGATDRLAPFVRRTLTRDLANEFQRVAADHDNA